MTNTFQIDDFKYVTRTGFFNFLQGAKINLVNEFHLFASLSKMQRPAVYATLHIRVGKLTQKHGEFYE
jgi:hypothetical protein